MARFTCPNRLHKLNIHELCFNKFIVVIIGTVGAVRLVGGLVPQQGHVEVCYNGSWSRVCSYCWSYRDSVVVCRQLNFPVTKISKKYFNMLCSSLQLQYH